MQQSPFTKHLLKSVILLCLAGCLCHPIQAIGAESGELRTETAVVPKVTGYSMTAAAVILAQDGFTDIKIDIIEQPPSIEDEEIVITQSPQYGSKISRAQTIRLEAYRSFWAVVPDVRKMHPEDALDSLKESGFFCDRRNIKIGYVRSFQPNEFVIFQFPQAGTRARLDTSIGLQVTKDMPFIRLRN